MSGRPAYVDEHSVLLPTVSPERAYAAVRSYAGRLVRPPTGAVRALTRVLGTDPPAGFEVAEEQPGRSVSLAGRHRFSRYVLDLRVDPAPDGAGSVVGAVTWADFPGPHGAVYRTLVVRGRAHVLVTRRMLAGIAALVT